MVRWCTLHTIGNPHPLHILSSILLDEPYVYWNCLNTVSSLPSESNTYKTKLLVVYTLLGWCMPLVIVVITVIVNFTTTDLVLYGELADKTTGSCWINHPESLYVSFLTPVIISLIYNTIVLIFVTIFLCVSSHSHSKVSGRKSSST